MFTSLAAIFLPLLAVLAQATAPAASAASGLTAQQWALILLGISTASSFVYGFVQKRKGDRSARLAQAAFAGIRKGVDDYAHHVDLWTTVEDAIYEAAKDLNVPAEHVDAHVGDGLIPPPPPTKSA